METISFYFPKHSFISEYNEHFVITCHSPDKFWEYIFNLLETVKLGKHILTLNIFIWGYKLSYIEYNYTFFSDSDYMFSIHKHTICQSLEKRISIYFLFFKPSLEIGPFYKKNLFNLGKRYI